MLLITFLSNMGQLYLTLGLCIAGIVILVVLALVFRHFYNKKHGISKDSKEKETKEEVIEYSEIPEVYQMFGGKDNVLSYELKGSRLVIELQDVDIAQIDKIKESGVDKVLTMSTKITLVGKGVKNILENLDNAKNS